MESCPSGRRCSTRNAVWGNSPRVRIPDSPPLIPFNADGILFLRKKGSEFMDTGDSSTNAGGRSTCFNYDEFIFLNSPQGI